LISAPALPFISERASVVVFADAWSCAACARTPDGRSVTRVATPMKKTANLVDECVTVMTVLSLL
jgi:hypothetical protein